MDHHPTLRWWSINRGVRGTQLAGAFLVVLVVALAAAPAAYAALTRPKSPTQPTVSTTTTTTSPLQPEQPVIDRSGDQPIVPHNDKADLYVTFPPSAPAFRHELLLMQSLQTVLKSEGYMTTLYYNTKEGTANDGTATAENFISMAKASVIVFDTHGFNYYLPHSCKSRKQGTFPYRHRTRASLRPPRQLTPSPVQSTTVVHPLQQASCSSGIQEPAVRRWLASRQFIKGGYSPNYFFLGDTLDDYRRHAYGLLITEAGIAHYFGQSHIDLVDALACHSLGFAPDFNAVSYYGYIPVSCAKDASLTPHSCGAASSGKKASMPARRLKPRRSADSERTCSLPTVRDRWCSPRR